MFSKLVLATTAAVVSAKHHQPMMILMNLNEDACPCPSADLNCMYAYPDHCNVEKCPCPEGDDFCYSAYPKHCIKDDLMNLNDQCPCPLNDASCYKAYPGFCFMTPQETCPCPAGALECYAMLLTQTTAKQRRRTCSSTSSRIPVHAQLAPLSASSLIQATAKRSTPAHVLRTPQSATPPIQTTADHHICS